jgi:anti-sigma-K factor RskA
MEITDDKLIASFLLGELLEDKRVGIEERMFKDDGFYEQVLAIQEELADDYVQNKLSTNQRLQFERHPKAERKPCDVACRYKLLLRDYYAGAELSSHSI